MSQVKIHIPKSINDESNLSRKVRKIRCYK